MSLTRRELIRVLGAAAALAKLPACGDNVGGNPVFSASRLQMLEALADVIIPPDDAPGGKALGTVAYITGLLQAYFGVGAPRIYAQGPFSDRNPFPDGTYSENDFQFFVELDRVTDAAWRQQLADIQAQLYTGLDAAIAMAHGASYQDIFDSLDDNFRSLLIDLVCEAAFAAPEYGGNPGLAGWQLVHFEGDSQPEGYSRFDGTSYVERPEAPLSTANPGDDPDPLTSDVRQVLAAAVAFLGGHVNR